MAGDSSQLRLMPPDWHVRLSNSPIHCQPVTKSREDLERIEMPNRIADGLWGHKLEVVRIAEGVC